MKRLNIYILIFFIGITAMQAENIIVTNSHNEGIGSLRDAVEKANDGDVITFSEAFTIYLETQISLGDKSIVIDGLVGNTKVRLDGNFKDEDNNYIDDDGVYTRIFNIVGKLNKTIEIKNVIIQNGSDNRASSTRMKGGGMYIDMDAGGDLFVFDCIIENNVLYSFDDKVYFTDGAGICTDYGGTFNNCIIRNNHMFLKNSHELTMFGAGISSYSNCKLNNCLIAGNTITIDPINNLLHSAIGAGLFMFNDDIINNCIILGNVIKSKTYELPDFDNGITAAGIFIKNGSIYNSTITYNSIYNIDLDINGDVDIGVGGFSVAKTIDGHIDFMNNIAYNNFSSIQGSFMDGIIDAGYAKNIAISDAKNFNSIHLDESCILLKSSPFSVDPSPGNDKQWGTGDDDYGILRLYPFSECINAGNPNQSEFDYLTNDFYSKARINDNRIDLGAVEFYESDVTFSLQGKVHGAENKVKGKVHAFKQSTTDRYAAECNINEDGSFFFRELTPDTYYLLAIPEEEGKYQPTYYGNELDMDKAIALNVNDKLLDVDINILTQDPLYTQQTNEAEIYLYPNPVESTLHILNNSNYPMITICNSVGTIVAQYRNSTNYIPMQHLPQGYYIVSFISAKETITKKILKK